MDSIGIETSKHVRLNVEPAPLLYRLLAWFYDACLFVGYVLLFFWLVEGLAPGDIFENLSINSMFIIGVMIPAILYHPLMETVWNGRTVGKRMLRIRVTRLDGRRASLGSYIMRWLFRFFEVTLTGGVGAILAILINGKGQRLGDMAGGTCVIKESKDRVSNKRIFKQADLERKIVFEQAAELSDQDIQVVKNLLNARQSYDRKAQRKLFFRARQAIEKKSGALDSEMSDFTYLTTIVKDYNTIYGSLDS